MLVRSYVCVRTCFVYAVYACGYILGVVFVCVTYCMCIVYECISP